MIKNPKDYVNPFSVAVIENCKQAQREREQRAEDLPRDESRSSNAPSTRPTP